MANAQLVVDASYSPTQLVQDVLLGQGVIVSNISYTGSIQARGYFDGQNCNVGLSEGVLLSTGPINNALGPNNDDGGGPPNSDFGLPGDAALESVSGINTNDAAILEFDFVPSSDSLSFRYVFASEEYLEFVNSGVNDAFGFFISGPGIPGVQNIALIPGTSQPVTIDDLNQGSFGQYYNNNGDGFQTPYSTSANYIQYDGFTDVLEAKATVTPCETYHIRLVIADGGDGIYDSGVFLEANSFSSGTVSLSAEASFVTNGSDTALIEGCGEAYIRFERSGVISTPLTITYNITGTATNGTDYDFIPGSVDIPAGQTVASVVLTPLFDGLAEGPETFILTASIGNVCLGNVEETITFTIDDPPPLTLSTFGDTSMICPGNVPIGAIANGGTGSYVYSWSNGSSTGNINPFVDSSATFVVTVTDTCGVQAQQGTVQVDIPTYFPMQITVNDATTCAGVPTTLVAKVTGGAAPYYYEWLDDLSYVDSVSVAPLVDTIYTVEVIDSCGATRNATGVVSVLQAYADFEWEYTDNRSMHFTNTSPDAVVFYWDFGDGGYTDEENPFYTYADSGTYMVTFAIENSDGCLDTTSKPILAHPDFHVYIPNAFTPGKNNINDFFLPKGEGYLGFTLDIYDRWGGHVFHTSSRRQPWRGLNKHGSILPASVYLYKARFITPMGQEVHRQGHVTLIR